MCFYCSRTLSNIFYLTLLSFFHYHHQHAEETTSRTKSPIDTEAENAALQVYYELLEKNHWRPLHSDVEKDVRRSNCENSLRIPYNDTKVIVRMPAEDYSNALEEFQESNPIDIIERTVILWNQHKNWTLRIVHLSLKYLKGSVCLPSQHLILHLIYLNCYDLWNSLISHHLVHMWGYGMTSHSKFHVTELFVL